ncbi:MAG: (2Fe-2S)-binding protein [Spirochaetia bacterium]|nr:(2Fe-2S)-binding protein [Spirochaetia bacterium]
MYVCICAAITDRQIQAAARGWATLLDLQQELCLGRSCGKCLPEAARIIEETQQQGQRSDDALTA